MEVRLYPCFLNTSMEILTISSLVIFCTIGMFVTNIIKNINQTFVWLIFFKLISMIHTLENNTFYFEKNHCIETIKIGKTKLDFRNNW